MSTRARVQAFNKARHVAIQIALDEAYEQVERRGDVNVCSVFTPDKEGSDRGVWVTTISNLATHRVIRRFEHRR